jgi:hypothetical protein
VPIHPIVVLSSRTKLSNRSLQVLTWLVLLVVGLGLSRRLVVCTQPCCGGHVKLAASCDMAAGPAAPAPETECCCCQHAAQSAPAPAGQPGEERAGARSGCSGCQHVSLGVDLGMPPVHAPLFDDLHGLVASASIVHHWLDADRLDVVHPPATGPPRCDRRTGPAGAPGLPTATECGKSLTAFRKIRNTRP